MPDCVEIKAERDLGAQRIELAAWASVTTCLAGMAGESNQRPSPRAFDRAVETACRGNVARCSQPPLAQRLVDRQPADARRVRAAPICRQTPRCRAGQEHALTRNTKPTTPIATAMRVPAESRRGFAPSSDRRGQQRDADEDPASVTDVSCQSQSTAALCQIRDVCAAAAARQRRLRAHRSTGGAPSEGAGAQSDDAGLASVPRYRRALRTFIWTVRCPSQYASYEPAPEPTMG